MRCSSISRHILTFLTLLCVLAGGAVCLRASADDSNKGDSNKYVFTHDTLDKMLGALKDLRAQNLPINIGTGSPDAEIANLEKQPKAASIIKNRGLSPREFVLTYKAVAQIREAQKARDLWQKTLQDGDASPQAKFEATQKLTDSLKTNLFTPEQAELVRRHMPDVEALLAPPK